MEQEDNLADVVGDEQPAVVDSDGEQFEEEDADTDFEEDFDLVDYGEEFIPTMPILDIAKVEMAKHPEMFEEQIRSAADLSENVGPGTMTRYSQVVRIYELIFTVVFRRTAQPHEEFVYITTVTEVMKQILDYMQSLPDKTFRGIGDFVEVVEITRTVHQNHKITPNMARIVMSSVLELCGQQIEY